MMSIFGQLTPLFVQYEAKWWWTSDLINSVVKRKPLLGWSAALQGRAWLQSRDRSWRVYCTECGVSCCIPVSGYSLIGLVDNVDNVDRPAWLGIGGGCAESAPTGWGANWHLQHTLEDDQMYKFSDCGSWGCLTTPHHSDRTQAKILRNKVTNIVQLFNVSLIVEFEWLITCMPCMKHFPHS